jgi:hypothetical protein
MTLSTDVEIREWARRCKACWEFELVEEMVKGEGMRLSALELRLFAQPGLHDPKAAARPFLAVYEELRGIAQRVALPGEGIRADVQPFDGRARLRNETGQQPEAMLLVRFVPAVPGQGGGKERARQIMAETEERLRALGLQHKAWAA